MSGFEVNETSDSAPAYGGTLWARLAAARAIWPAAELGRYPASGT